MMVALESEKDHAQHFKQQISTCILMYCLYRSGFLAVLVVGEQLKVSRTKWARR
jgi:hypothetical protein